MNLLLQPAEEMLNICGSPGPSFTFPTALAIAVAVQAKWRARPPGSGVEKEHRLSQSLKKGYMLCGISGAVRQSCFRTSFHENMRMH